MNDQEYNPVCPLCRRPSSAAGMSTAGTRLCDECRSLVETVHPSQTRPSSTPAYPAPVSQAPVYSAKPGSVSTVSATENVSGAIPHPDGGKAAVAAPSAASSLAEDSFPAERGSADAPHSQDLEEQRSPTSPEAQEQPGSAGESPADFDWPLLTDPPQARRGGSLKWLAIGVGVIVLGGLGGIAYFYVGGFAKSEANKTQVSSPKAEAAPGGSSQGGAPRTGPQSKTSEPGRGADGADQPKNADSQKMAAIGRADQNPQPQASQPASAVQSGKAGSAAPQPTPPPGGDSQPAAPAGKGSQLALQAASFPNQTEAGKFAEKLVRAGVPAYVVTAKLAHRGTWFRVRVGKFDTAAEAQRSIALYHSRAASAGLELHLIQCEYERP
jgi:hypothetical protein